MSLQEDPTSIFFLEIDHPQLTGELGAEPVSLCTEEGLSDVQTFTLEFRVDKQRYVDLNRLLGEGIHVRVGYRNGILSSAVTAARESTLAVLDIDQNYRRHYYGWVTAGYDIGQHGETFVYRLEMSSWLWFLGQNRNSRIFQTKRVPDVISEVFSRYSQIASYELDLAEEYPEREYCVQFAETDLNFVNRLLEEEGIWYYFRHEADKHTMVITDRQDFTDMPGGYHDLPWQPNGSSNKASSEGIQEIHRSRKVRPNEVVLRDYDYLRPGNNLQVDQESSADGLPNVQLEWYQYAAGYQNVEQGERLARLRLQMMQSERQILTGRASAIGMVSGNAFTLNGHEVSELNRRFKVLSVACTFIVASSGSGGEVIDTQAWCTFRALNDEVPYRPLLRTPRPDVSGLQSATVVGPPGAEVYTDKHARIKVHFHWDRYKNREEDSSCWVRVAQAWAGKGWGVIAMPRVGQEVLITYVDGDLDKPLVTGIVYNGENPPPYDLPGQIGHTGIKSRSLSQGNRNNFSEITLIDDRGAEKVLIHAERDQINSVEHDLEIRVENDRYDYVGNLYRQELNNHCYSANFRYSMTGTAVQLTGQKIDITGLHSGTTGVDLQVTGVGTTITGVNTTMDGVATHLTALETNITGLKTSMASTENEILGVKNKIGGTENVLQANRNSFIASNNEFIGTDNAAVVSRSQMVGVNNKIVGVNTELCGINTVRSGNLLNMNGAEVSVVGVRNEDYGVYSSNIGVRTVNVGTTINNTGTEIRTVHLLMIN